MTKGIKTSLHEARHAIIAELFDWQVQSVAVIERFNGRTRYNRELPTIENAPKGAAQIFLCALAPYVNRILTMPFEAFVNEYGNQNDIILNTERIINLMIKDKWTDTITKLKEVLDDNKIVIDKVTEALEVNGKRQPAKINRQQFITILTMNGGLKSKEKLNELVNNML